MSRFNAASPLPGDSGREWLVNPLNFGRYPAMADLLNQWQPTVLSVHAM
jgi:hypothetical protein